MLIVSGTLQIRADKREEAVAAAVAMATATQAEVGCLTYNFYADLTDPTRFLVYEEWESAEALAAHSQTPHMAIFRAQMAQLAAAPTAIKRYEATLVR